MTIPSRRLAHTLVDALALAGVRHACIAPGSRSAPIALALADNATISSHVHLDERSAAFMTLGMATATRTPAIVTCTSGTAAANFLPAIREADLMGVPLIVLTADRPPELRDTGANQTLDQIKMYGHSVRWFCEVGPADGHPEGTGEAYWQSLAVRAVAEATGSNPGPVHLNIPFREPLVERGQAPAPSAGATPTRVTRSVGVPRDEDLDRLVAEFGSIERGVVVAGAGCTDPDAAVRLAEHLGWPLLAEPLSNARHGGSAIVAYDALLRAPGWSAAHRPDAIVRFGKIGISKALVGLCASTRELFVDPHGRWWDPTRSLDELIVADPAAVADGFIRRIPSRATSEWLQGWKRADELASETIGSLLNESTTLSEPRVARDLVGTVPDGTNVVVGASMPLRDVEFFAPARADISFFGNRGANGIDGFVSTAIGIAIASGRPTVALCGDLTLLHDSNGFLGVEHRAADVTFVVINNEGGGIFSFLPQADLPEHFEALFGTPQARDLQDLARFHRIDHQLIDDAAGLATALEGGDGVRLLEVRTDRADNVALHRQLEDAVRQTLGG